MAIVNMIGVDNIADRSGLGRIIEAGNKILQGTTESNLSVSIATINNTKWMNVFSPGDGGSNNINKYLRLFGQNATIGEVFGNPSQLTKGVIGFRVIITSLYRTSNPNICLINNSATSYLPGEEALLSSLPLGEHFFEYVFDLVNGKIEWYANGDLQISYNTPLTLDSRVGLAPKIYQYGASRADSVMPMRDFYFVWDTQDDSPCDRLGPIKVNYLPVDEVIAPEGWQWVTEQLLTYPNNATPMRPLIPLWMNAVGPTFEDKVSMTVTNLTYGAPQYVLNPATPNNNLGSAAFAGNNGETSRIIQVMFDKPKKVGAYGVGNPVASLNRAGSWVLEAGNDGSTWTILDTRTNVHTGELPDNSVRQFTIPEQNRGLYRYYRWRVTFNIGSSTNGYSSAFYVAHFNLLGFIEDDAVNLDAVGWFNAPYPAAAAIDRTTMTWRSSTDESEATFKMRQPEVGTSDILAVQLHMSSRRDSGSEEHLVVRVKQGEAETESQAMELDPDFRHGVLIRRLPKSLTDEPWTAAAVGQLNVVIKSKTGES